MQLPNIKSNRKFTPLSAWSALILSLLFTGFAYYMSVHFNKRNAAKNFETETQNVMLEIDTLFQNYEHVLRGAAGLFNSSTSVERDEWKNYISTFDVKSRFPGIQIVGFAQYLNGSSDKNHFVAKVRDEGFSDFNVDPPGEREEYFPVTYLEPFNERNRRAFGYDMFSEPKRHEAMVRARDYNLPSLTQKVILRQDIGDHEEPGVLLFLPIYQNNKPHIIVKERRLNLAGFVYCGFRINEMMAGLVSRQAKGLAFKIYDGEANDDHLLFDNRMSMPDSTDYLRDKKTIEIAGREWDVFFTAPIHFELKEAEIFQSKLILFGGLTISLLLFVVLLMLVNAQVRATELANQMTIDLQQETKKHQEARMQVEESMHFMKEILDQLPVALYCKDVMKDQFILWNNMCTQFFGVSSQNVIGKNSVPTDKLKFPSLEVGDREAVKMAGSVVLDRQEIKTEHFNQYLRTVKMMILGQEDKHRYLLSISNDITENVNTEKRKNASFEISNHLSVATNSDAVLKKILITFCTELNWDYGGLWTIHDRQLHLKEWWAMPDSNLSEFVEASRKLSFSPGLGMPGRVWKEKKSMWIRDISKDPGFLRADVAKKCGIQSGFSFPVIFDGEVILIFDFFSFEKRPKDEALLAMCEIMGNQAGLFMKKKDAEEKERIALDIKADFISMVSHELRTPMTVIRESISIVYDGSSGPINDEQKDFLDTAKRNVERLSRLINNVLDYQKLEARAVSFKMEFHNINKIVEEVAQGFQMISKRGGPPLEVELDKNLPKIKFDSDKIIQVLTNFLNNAFNYAGKGKVVVRTRMQGNNLVRIEVKDEGPGIKQEDIGKLFERFSQIESVNERKTGSSGLGLAISKMIIESHSGKVGIESEFGKGSTFYFLLPIVERRATVIM